MGLRDLLRKYKKRHDASPSASPTNKTKIQQLPPPPPPPSASQQQEKQDKSGLTSIDLNSTA